MVLDRDALLERIRTYVGENNDDEAISFIEDVNDSISALTPNEDWKQKYEENDAAWRKKYKDRFFSPSKEDDDDFTEDKKPKQYRYEDLFTTN